MAAGPDVTNARRREQARRRRRTIRVSLLIVLIAGAVVAALELTAGSSHQASPGSTGNGAFRLAYPKGWEVIPPPSSPASEGPSLAAVATSDRRGLVVVHRGARASIDPAFIAVFESRLAQRVPDYHALKSAIIKVANRDALFVSYVRANHGLLVTITVIPVGNRSYMIDSSSPASDQVLATDIGEIIHSFRIALPSGR